MTLTVSKAIKISRKQGIMTGPLSMNLFELVIVVPVKDNQAGVNTFLQSFKNNILAAHYPKAIIFVDNNSKTALTVPKHICQDLAVTIEVVTCNKPGAAAARNVGAKLAIKKFSAKWILFMDSDCLFQTSTLKNLANNLDGSVAYQCKIAANSNDWISKFYTENKILEPASMKEFGSKMLRPEALITAGALVLAKAFEAVSGFAEIFPNAGGEDLLLGYKLRMIGKLGFKNDVIIHHDFITIPGSPNYSDLQSLVARFLRYGVGNALLKQYMLSEYDIELSNEPNIDLLLTTNKLTEILTGIKKSADIEKNCPKTVFSQQQLLQLIHTCMHYGYYGKKLPINTSDLQPVIENNMFQSYSTKMADKLVLQSAPNAPHTVNSKGFKNK